MTALALDGLDGANPLHVLAAFGAFAITDDLAPGARLSWERVGGAYAPRIAVDMERTAWCDAVAARLRAMGTVKASDDAAPLRRKADELGASIKKKRDAWKRLRNELKAEAKALKLTPSASRDWAKARLEPLEHELDGLTQGRADAQMGLAASMGFGPAHLGEMIGVAADIFRLHASHALAHDPIAARQLGALATDGCVTADGAVQPTPYSFSNGGSGKKLLKDFRALALACTREHVEASVFEGAPIGADMTALNWDPRDLRSYAHQWRDPANMKVLTDVAANALAYVGLGLLPCFPGRRGLEAVGMVREGRSRGFNWPVWSPPLSMPMVRALLAAASAPAFAGDIRAAEARGVFAVHRAEVVNPTGKRNYFGPAAPKRW